MNTFDFAKAADMIQKQVSSLQEALAGVAVTGSAGGGMVESDMNGKMDVLDVRIAEEAAGDVDMIEDLVTAAHADAVEKARRSAASQLGSQAGIANLSGLMSMLGGGS
jgi:DNA-binding YbaB/EbfC family protein